MQKLGDAAEVAACRSDLMVRWAAQALEPGYPHERGAAWRLGDAVAVYAPRLNQANRLVCAGPDDEVAALAGTILPSLDDAKIRLIAEESLAAALAERLDLHIRATFGWMHLERQAPTTATPGVEWLAPDDAAQIDALLRRANPRSFLFPDDPGALRWAGIRGEGGRLLSVAGDCWPAPGIRYISGVATDPDARGQGLATRVCTFLTRELARFGEVTLMADGDNVAALAVYRRLGFTYTSISAAASSAG